MPAVFADPDAVVDLIRGRAPYPTLSAHHGFGDTMTSRSVMPWFRTNLQDEGFLRAPSWLAAAREAFDAELVEPFKCILNINPPTPEGAPHVDLPVYRGMQSPGTPPWLLMNMTYSGLFNDWLAPVASGLAWFYRGEGGGLEYWPDGPKAASRIEVTPLWNVGLMSDNDFMWHRVCAIGPEAEQSRLEGQLRASDTLHNLGGDNWEIRDQDRVVCAFGPDQLRISLLWKARVFSDGAHRASFDDQGMNLTPEQVVDVYLDDLAGRGIRMRRPSNPLDDKEWREALQTTYPPSFAGAGDYQ
jgi:hypothetical protein